MKLFDIRKEYLQRTLKQRELNQNPFEQFKSWLEDAMVDCMDPNACTFATATKEGVPSSRTLLLKEIDDRGFIFFTHYHSQKGKEIEENPLGSMTFYWKENERQVTIDGKVEKVSEEISDAYFSLRTRESKLGAWASEQGHALHDRKELETKYKDFEMLFESKKIPRPPYWGGYRLIPNHFIFWQGRKDRLHDRFLYKKKETTWQMTRIAP